MCVYQSNYWFGSIYQYIKTSLPIISVKLVICFNIFSYYMRIKKQVSFQTPVLVFSVTVVHTIFIVASTLYWNWMCILLPKILLDTRLLQSLKYSNTPLVIFKIFISCKSTKIYFSCKATVTLRLVLNLFVCLATCLAAKEV